MVVTSSEYGNTRVVIGMGFSRTVITCFLWGMIHFEYITIMANIGSGDKTETVDLVKLATPYEFSEAQANT